METGRTQRRPQARERDARRAHAGVRRAVLSRRRFFGTGNARLRIGRSQETSAQGRLWRYPRHGRKHSGVRNILVPAMEPSDRRKAPAKGISIPDGPECAHTDMERPNAPKLKTA